jgi:hypothetical protein
MEGLTTVDSACGNEEEEEAITLGTASLFAIGQAIRNSIELQPASPFQIFRCAKGGNMRPHLITITHKYGRYPHYSLFPAKIVQQVASRYHQSLISLRRSCASRYKTHEFGHYLSPAFRYLAIRIFRQATVHRLLNHWRSNSSTSSLISCPSSLASNCIFTLR